MSDDSNQVVVASVELELEIVYDGLSRDEIEGRLASDTETVINSMPRITSLSSPPVLGFRLVDRCGGHYFHCSIPVF
jgi:hypothetical protein